MTPVIINRNKQVVYEGIDFIDCFDTLKYHFLNAAGYKVIDHDTGEEADKEAVLRIRNSASDMINYGG